MKPSEKVLLSAIQASEGQRKQYRINAETARIEIEAMKNKIASLEKRLSDNEAGAAECVQNIAEFEAAIQHIKAADLRRRIYGKEVVR